MKPTARLSFESSSPDVGRLCLQFKKKRNGTHLGALIISMLAENQQNS